MTPEQRTLRGKIGAYSLHAQHDTRVVSAPGRAAAAKKLNDRLLTEIDPNGRLSEAERSRRLESARKAHFAKLALRSARVRGKK